MNGYERTMAALRGEPHDRVPVMLHNFMMAAREINVSMGSFREHPKLIAQAFIHAVEKYGYDAVLVDVDTVTLAGSLGVPVDFPENEPARPVSGLLDSLEDVKRLQPPKVDNYRYIQHWLEAVRLLRQYFGNEVLIRGNCDQAPFTLAAMLRGANHLMLDLLMAEQQLIVELLEYCTEASCQFIRLMAQAGAHVVSNGDSVAGPAMISPEQYENFALPYEKTVVKEAHKQGLPYILHICGNTDLILELMLKTNADAFEIDYKTDVYKAFDILHDRATFIGNIDPSGVIALGTPELVRQKTTELLDILGKTNRFILNSGCAIPAITPEENISRIDCRIANPTVFKAAMQLPLNRGIHFLILFFIFLNNLYAQDNYASFWNINSIQIKLLDDCVDINEIIFLEEDASKCTPIFSGRFLKQNDTIVCYNHSLKYYFVFIAEGVLESRSSIAPYIKNKDKFYCTRYKCNKEQIIGGLKEWENDKKHGKWHYIDSCGDRFIIIYEEGKIIEKVLVEKNRLPPIGGIRNNKKLN